MKEMKAELIKLISFLLGKFPMLNWSTDNYAIWLSQNALNLQLGVGGGLAQAVIGTAMLPFTRWNINNISN